MGVMPDYTYYGEGMRIDGVTDGKPAFKAGLIKGDVIKKLGNTEIKNVQDYMKELSNFKKGDTAPLEVLRNGEIKTFSVTF
jgi:S1-C subfamily serine protease